MDYEANFTKLNQAWFHVFLNQRNNLFQTKGKLVRMVNQMDSKVSKADNKLRLILIQFFFWQMFVL